MSVLRVPRGGLFSWSGVTFRPNRSKLMSGVTLTADSSHEHMAGTLQTVDGFARGVAPFSYVLPYEYKIFCGPGDSVNYVQTHWDALLAAWGANQVGTLVCLLQGNTGVTVSGIARLERITETSGDPFSMTVSLEFFLERGMT